MMNRSARDKILETLLNLLRSTSKHEYNFVSAILKGLIKLIQRFKKFVGDINVKEISIQSNTLDYAVLFTEENLIQSERNPGDVEVSMDSIHRHEEMINNQWSDLADYYQFLNEPDLVESVILQLLEGENQSKLIKALK